MLMRKYLKVGALISFVGENIILIVNCFKLQLCRFFFNIYLYINMHLYLNKYHLFIHINTFRSELNRLPRVKTCATLMKTICYNNKDALMAGLICGGWDPYDGGQIYEIPLGGTLVKQKFAIGGSGSTYIYGLVDSLYKEGMTKTECRDFVTKSKFYKNIKYLCKYIYMYSDARLYIIIHFICLL